MLSRSDAELVARQINEWARRTVAPVVMDRLDLPRDAFEAFARAFADDFRDRRAASRTEEGEAFDDLDELLVAAVFRAMMRLYLALRCGGAAGHA